MPHTVPQMGIHLSYNGGCADAFAFYAANLGGTVEMTMGYGESPMAGEVSEAERGRVMHTTLLLGNNQRLMGADAVAHAPYTGSAVEAESMTGRDDPTSKVTSSSRESSSSGSLEGC